MTDPVAHCEWHGEFSLHTGCLYCEEMERGRRVVATPRSATKPDMHISSRHGIDEAMGGHHHGYEGEDPVPKLRDYTSEERKGMPVYTGVLLYFPDALAAISRVSKKGNDKHNPGEPLHWSREKSKDHGDCAVRHFITPGAVDPDSGEIELAHAAWRILAELQLREEKRILAAGIKPLSGKSPHAGCCDCDICMELRQ